MFDIRYILYGLDELALKWYLKIKINKNNYNYKYIKEKIGNYKF